MGKEKIIEQADLTFEKAKEGAFLFRGQMNFGLIPEVEDDATLLDMALFIRQEYNRGIRETRNNLEVFKERVLNPVVKLPIELSYPRLKVDGRHVGVCTCLIPSLLFNEAIDDRDLAAFLDWFCSLRAGNQIRVFGWGGWESHTWKWLVHPFILVNPGLYDLELWNEEYFNMVDRRLGMLRERNLTTVISLNDHCTLKPKPLNAYWDRIFWNGKNNVNETATEWGGMYHWYEEEHKDKKDWIKLGQYLVRYYRSIFQLYMKYWPFIKFEFGNEVRAAQGWHQLMYDIADEYRPKGYDKFPKFGVQSSVSNLDDNWLKEKRLEEVCEISIHGMCNSEKYRQRLAEVGKPGVKYIISQDGCPPTPGPGQTREFIGEVLGDGHLAIELNLRPLHEYHNEWKNMGKDVDWSFQRMMETSEPWFKAAGEALQGYAGV